MGILGIGAGASGGLDNYLHQLLQEQQQAEAERRNRATEALATRGQDLSEAQHRLATQQRGDVLAANEQNRTVGRAALRGIGDVVQPGEQAQELGAGVPSSAYSKIPGLRSASTTGFQTAPDVASTLTGFGSGIAQSGQAKTTAEQGSPTTQWAGTGAQREQIARDEREQRKLDILENKQPTEHNRPTILTDKGFVYSDTGEPVKSPEGRQLQGKPPAPDRMLVLTPEGYQPRSDVTNKITHGQPVEGPLPAMTRQRQKSAVQVSSHIQDVTDEVDEADRRGLLGPLEGRWAEFMRGKIASTGNPENDELLNTLRTDLTLMASGTMMTHFGARGGQNLIEGFKRDVLDQGKMTPAGLKGALHSIKKWLDTYGQIPGQQPQQGRGSADDLYNQYLARTKPKP